jgi:hypothetical protein
MQNNGKMFSFEKTLRRFIGSEQKRPLPNKRTARKKFGIHKRRKSFSRFFIFFRLSSKVLGKQRSTIFLSKQTKTSRFFVAIFMRFILKNAFMRSKGRKHSPVLFVTLFARKRVPN